MISETEKSYKLASRDAKKEDTLISLRAGGQARALAVGGNNFVVIAGPCSVESEEQTLKIAREVKKAGAHILRGGAFKPRTSPYSFQGLGEEGLKILKTASEETGLPVVSEALDTKNLELVGEYVDIIQIGSRNMQNFSLLKEVGKLDKPVFLKRGFASTIEEWLLSAEYVLAEGNSQVILCERGIRTFSNNSRITLDLNAVPVVRRLSHLPVVVDPSHGTGRADCVSPMARAAAAAGAQGVMIEVHAEPSKALSDGAQAISPEEFSSLMRELKQIAGALNLKFA